jgi:hypothetical protein
MPVDAKAIEVPALPWITEWDTDEYPPAPAIDQHGDALREEFGSPDIDNILSAHHSPQNA